MNNLCQKEIRRTDRKYEFHAMNIQNTVRQYLIKTKFKYFIHDIKNYIVLNVKVTGSIYII